MTEHINTNDFFLHVHLLTKSDLTNLNDFRISPSNSSENDIYVKGESKQNFYLIFLSGTRNRVWNTMNDILAQMESSVIEWMTWRLKDHI